ncbi:MAG: type II toxin-antitoxin system HicB family antitoxin [Mycobacteriales bacterium]
MREFEVLLDPQPEGGYTVTVPALPGCISEGDTREEALKMIKEAIELYLEPLASDHELAATDREFERVQVAA